MARPTGELRIENVVLKADLGRGIPLTRLAESHRAVIYRPKDFAAAVIRIYRPRSTTLVFSSGRIICIGNRSLMEALRNALTHVMFLRSLGLRVYLRHIEYINSVSSLMWPHSVNLEALVAANTHCCSWTPQMFPGVAITIDDPTEVVRNYTVFHTGAVNVVGRANVHATLEHVRRFLVPKLLQAGPAAAPSAPSAERRKRRRVG